MRGSCATGVVERSMAGDKKLTAKDIMKALFVILRYEERGAFIVHKQGQLIGIKRVKDRFR